MRKLAVLGSPIAHSKSPALHQAAYKHLDLAWSYEAIDVTEHELAPFVATLEEGWRGLSLTMPLKRTVLPLLTATDPIVSQTGVANTVVFDEKRRLGFNTDVYGITAAFREQGIESASSVTILGGGATAASALVAAQAMGADRATVLVRTLAAADALVFLGSEIGVPVTVASLAEPTPIADIVISTLPGGTDFDVNVLRQSRQSAVLLDVAYDPWPSALAASWHAPVISGLAMLTHQALAQVRAFVNGSPEIVFDHEELLLAAMKDAVAPSAL